MMDWYLNYLLYETTGRSVSKTVFDSIVSTEGDSAAGRKRTSRKRQKFELALNESCEQVFKLSFLCDVCVTIANQTKIYLKIVCNMSVNQSATDERA